MNRCKLLLCLVGLASLLAVATPVEAQTTDEIHACFVQRTGLIYRIDPDAEVPGDLPEQCRNQDRHFHFSWSTGVPGWEIVEARRASGSSAGGGSVGVSTHMSCPEGKVVLSGGHRVEVLEGFIDGLVGVEYSYPSAPDTWRFRVEFRDGPETSWELWAYVICAGGS